MADDNYRPDTVQLHVLLLAHFHVEPGSAVGDAVNGPDPPNNTQLPAQIEKGTAAATRLLLLLYIVTFDCLLEAF